MQKGILISLIVASLLVTAFQNCAKGTDTGNPMQSSSSLGSQAQEDLASTVCATLENCYSSMNSASCYQSVNELPGLGEKFGSPSASASLKDLSTTPYNTTAMSACQTQISALTCSDPGVQAAYNPTTAYPYGGALNMIPQSGACPQIY